ncbi:Trihelix transcription factor asr3 [Thalictrum thalictroides]|uniref:Trihelix transcription factor asr3 n=1 Tax=Thalictrum thalictroides TaxID=46969 RepID=A0A7J6VBG3_THATH|nr:Trihelix transcription factor asr3 [Thalictrum thalictroides]
MALEIVDGKFNAVNTTVNDDGNRAPRLPRWTRQEILVLIQGKKVAETRVRSRRTNNTTGSNQVEPKWASVSSYCKRHGVNRGPVQCRKRWSNLSGDFKKIKEWESVKSGGESESFWVMRNDLRRERKLPGFFDKEVYDILDGGNDEITVTVTEEEEEEKVKDNDEEFSDFEEQEEKVDLDKVTVVVDRVTPKPTVPAPLPISEKLYDPSCQRHPEQGTTSERQNASYAEKESLLRDGKKRKRCPSEDGETRMQDQLIKVLERNSKMLTTHLETQNINCALDRDLRKDQANSLVTVLSKLADALGKIADKL